MIHNLFLPSPFSKVMSLINSRTLSVCLLLGLLNMAASGLKGQVIYETNWKNSGVFIGSGIVLLGSAKLVDNSKNPITIEDLLNLDGNSISQFDRSALSRTSKKSDKYSDYFRDGIYFAPLSLLLSSRGKKHTKEILFMYSSALSLNSGLTFLTKSVVDRYRPLAYSIRETTADGFDPSLRRSFFSGHVSHVSCLSFFTASVFNDLFPDSNFRPVVWTLAASVPAITAYLRYDAGKHFPTDVITGYLVGAVVGFLTPKLHKIKDNSKLSLTSTAQGIGLRYRLN